MIKKRKKQQISYWYIVCLILMHVVADFLAKGFAEMDRDRLGYTEHLYAHCKKYVVVFMLIGVLFLPTTNWYF